jgi:hypothetical protein
MQARVNYHRVNDERPAYYIDADGVTGKIIAPEHEVAQVHVRDVRTGEADVRFASDSIAFVRNPSQIVEFDEDESWRGIYDAELTQFLKEQIDAKEVLIFDHTVRVDDPDSGRQPARNVHSDYSPEGAHQRLRDIVGEHQAENWKAGHFAFINLWRPVKHPITSAPLGFVLPKSVATKDWRLIDLIYPDRIGQIMGLVANSAHLWVYNSHMTPDEVAYFNIYDNMGQPSIAHSALDVVDGKHDTRPRMSIESRTLVRY